MNAETHVRAILRNTGWSQAGLASRLGVDQSTVCKWHNGSRSPTVDVAQVLGVLARVTSEKALLLGAGILAAVDPWHYLCARAPAHQATQRSMAISTFHLLRDAVKAALGSDRLAKTDDFWFLFSVVSIAAPFPDRSRAFVFGDHAAKPRRFVILVNSKLDGRKQMEEAIAEIGAHVRPYVIGLDSPIRANAELL